MTREVRLHADVAASLDAICRRNSQQVEEIVNAVLRSHFALPSPDDGERLAVPESARLRLAEETLESLVDAVITIDRHADIEYMNPAAEELTGWQLDDVRTRPLGSAIHITSADADWLAQHVVQTCLQEGEPAEIQDDAVLLNRGGQEVAVDGVASPLRNQSGNIVGAALIMRDITARRQVEAELVAQRNNLEQLVEKRTADLKALQNELLQKERLAALGHLTATVSHEIRNPLGTIRNSLHVLEQRIRGRVEGLDPLLARIDRNISRCARIIAELLDFTNVRDLNPERIDVDSWVGQVLDEIEIPPGITVHRLLAAQRVVALDPERMRRALVNLLENACQAMTEHPAGAPGELVINTRAIPSKVEIVIADNGPGMAEEVRSQIFRELFSTKRFGIGLGLPIVKQIVEQHSGEVHVQSTLGLGTRVIIRLPISGDSRAEGATAAAGHRGKT